MFFFIKAFLFLILLVLPQTLSYDVKDDKRFWFGFEREKSNDEEKRTNIMSVLAESFQKFKNGQTPP